MDLSGRTVFLTGGAQGIGRAVLEGLLDKGAKVLFCDNNLEVASSLENELKMKYNLLDFDFFHCDVCNATQLYDAFQAAVKRFGSVEICINNAGIVDEFDWERTLAVNMTAQIRGSKLAFEHMRRDQGGRGGVIVNTVSVAGYTPFHFCPVYAASKHAMIGYTTSCARDPDNEAAGVRWCCVCPTAVNTQHLDLEGKVKNAEELEKISKSKAIEPQAVAQAFLQLLQDVDNNGKIMEVSTRGAVYRQRVVLDEDGESNKVEVDSPLTKHPPVPSSPQNQ